MSGVEDVAARSLVEDMIQHQPDRRPEAKAVLDHPYLQQPGEMMRLLQVR